MKRFALWSHRIGSALSSTFPTRSPTLSHAAVGSNPKDSRQSKAPIELLIELLAPGSLDGLLFQSLPSDQNNKTSLQFDGNMHKLFFLFTLFALLGFAVFENLFVQRRVPNACPTHLEDLDM